MISNVELICSNCLGMIQTYSESKNISTDRRLTCGSPIEFAYYTVQHAVKGTVGRAFYGDKLKTSDTKTFKTLLEKECKVLPSCGKSVCLSMNTKANF